MSLRPAAEWRDAWLKGDRTLRDFILAIQANARQAGREAGFAEAIAAGLTSLASESANWERNEERVIEFCMARLRALTCPPAADGSEGSDGE